MPTITFHPSESRGKADHGWLLSRHTFSFAGYHNPGRMHFGALRVLNDDIVQAGMGFGKHPHDNMEIISIPLLGQLEHRDSMGNVAVISEGDVQVMSAGTGITHSEYNKKTDREVHFLQIWVYPRQKNLSPRYGQISLKADNMHNKLLQVVSPGSEDEGTWIYQDAWFSMGNFENGHQFTYQLHQEDNGVYLFVLSGGFSVLSHRLEARDGMGISGISTLELESTMPGSSLLLMEVPMMW
jgi:quercetin 2,3-dioxygenase